MRENYISELLISFLPYSIGISFFLIIIGIYHIIIYRKRITILSISIIACIGSMILLYLSRSEYTHVYQPNDATNLTLLPNHKDGLSFFYANIYYKNQDFTGIMEVINEKNTDIVLLVEYSKNHDEELAPILKEKYPYVSRYVGGKGYDGDVIYSKYPLQKIKHTEYPGSFSHVTINYNNKNIDLALIHTSAPSSLHFFTMRNEQLNELATLMTDYYSTKKEQKVILLGDFNITPRSSYYTLFSDKMKKLSITDISNNTSQTTYNSSTPYTRCHEQASWICSHIDHVRSNQNTMKLEKITIPGSDHYGFVGFM